MNWQLFNRRVWLACGAWESHRRLNEFANGVTIAALRGRFNQFWTRWSDSRDEMIRRSRQSYTIQICKTIWWPFGNQLSVVSRSLFKAGRLSLGQLIFFFWFRFVVKTVSTWTRFDFNGNSFGPFQFNDSDAFVLVTVEFPWNNASCLSSTAKTATFVEKCTKIESETFRVACGSYHFKRKV